MLINITQFILLYILLAAPLAGKYISLLILVQFLLILERYYRRPK